jgi:hypothetical protein
VHPERVIVLKDEADEIKLRELEEKHTPANWNLFKKEFDLVLARADPWVLVVPKEDYRKEFNGAFRNQRTPVDTAGFINALKDEGLNEAIGGQLMFWSLTKLITRNNFLMLSSEHLEYLDKLYQLGAGVVGLRFGAHWSIMSVYEDIRDATAHMNQKMNVSLYVKQGTRALKKLLPFWNERIETWTLDDHSYGQIGTMQYSESVDLLDTGQYHMFMFRDILAWAIRKTKQTPLLGWAGFCPHLLKTACFVNRKIYNRVTHDKPLQWDTGLVTSWVKVFSMIANVHYHWGSDSTYLLRSINYAKNVNTMRYVDGTVEGFYLIRTNPTGLLVLAASGTGKTTFVEQFGNIGVVDGDDVISQTIHWPKKLHWWRGEYVETYDGRTLTQRDARLERQAILMDRVNKGAIVLTGDFAPSDFTSAFYSQEDLDKVVVMLLPWKQHKENLIMRKLLKSPQPDIDDRDWNKERQWIKRMPFKTYPSFFSVLTTRYCMSPSATSGHLMYLILLNKLIPLSLRRYYEYKRGNLLMAGNQKAGRVLLEESKKSKEISVEVGKQNLGHLWHSWWEDYMGVEAAKVFLGSKVFSVRMLRTKEKIIEWRDQFPVYSEFPEALERYRLFCKGHEVYSEGEDIRSLTG